MLCSQQNHGFIPSPLSWGCFPEELPGRNPTRLAQGFDFPQGTHQLSCFPLFFITLSCYDDSSQGTQQTLWRKKSTTHTSKIHLTSPMAPAQPLWVSVCYLVLFAVSASAGLKNCPVKAGFAELPGQSQWSMAVLPPGGAFPWDLF